ncbi:Multidrug resistance-associated protein 1 [Picochlorum sp. SENEW3]|nr:Multidrug resistance-associated protein 1 [Picochlorum sp. SENEW3]
MDSFEVEETGSSGRRILGDSSSSGFWRFFGDGLGRVFGKRTQSFRPLPTEEEEGLGEDVSSYLHRWCPEEEAGTMSGLFFAWVGGLLKLGRQKALEQHDLWDIAHQDDAFRVSDSFRKQLISTADSIEAPEGRIGWAMWKAHRKMFIIAGLIKFFHDCIMFLGPFILEVLLKHIQGDGSRWLGIVFALALTVANIVQTLAVNKYFHILFRICLHLKTGLVNSLYEKSLRLAAGKVSDLGVGSVVNLQSNDAAKLWKLPQYLHMIWSGPFQILTVMGLLIRIIHFWPAFVGLAVTVTIIPLSTIVARALARIRKRVVKLTDARVKLASEVIIGIKAIKLYAWEEAYCERIQELRRKELGAIRTAALVGLWNNILWLGGPIVISMAAFYTYTMMGYELTAAVAFPALSLFNLLRFPVMMFPTQLMNIVNGKVALDRIQAFMESDEMAQAEEQAAGAPAVSIAKGSFSWMMGHDTLLHDINLSVGKGQFAIVVGEVGSGKTSLLAAILGEMLARSGKVTVRGSVAYTQQDPWIQNASLKENILLDREYDEEKYNEVIRACALVKDLAMLPAGDETEIGEKGVNLSGGQRHRVALARACYGMSDVYLLDDPLSAVDAHVGRQLLNECLLGLLKTRTRILVTHQLQYLPAADVVIVVKGGKIIESGTYESLVDRGIDFHQFEMESLPSSSSTSSIDAGDGSSQDDTTKDGDQLSSSIASSSEGSNGEAPLSLEKASAKNSGSEAKGEGAATDADVSLSRKKLTKAEERAVGQVNRKVYMKYFLAWGPMLIIPSTVLFLAMTERGLQSAQSWWLSVWSTASEERKLAQSDSLYYMKVYFLLGFVSLGVQVVRAVVLVLGSLLAAGTLQNSLLATVLRLPMSFFDSQPTGRLLNRFTKDVEAVDTSLQASVSSFLNCTVSVFWSLIVVVAVSPTIALAFVPIAFAYASIQKRYIATSRELKRLDSLAMSPIFSHFSETVQGLTVVRAFRAQGNFESKNKVLLNESNRCFWPTQCVNRWLSVRLELLGTFVVLCSAVFVSGIMPTSAGLAGLALTSALNLTGLMSWMVRQTTELEVNMNSVERLMEYDDEKTEAPAIVPTNRPLPEWPTRGEIQVENLVVRYRPELDPVLHGISFSVKSGEKIGIAGRTGCGKSTLMMALYRIVEPWSGRVIIDSIDVGAIGLRDLRSRLSLVPQDPIVFSGSVRSNIDPFNNAEHDDELWEALSQAGLANLVRKLDGGLDAPIAESGGNLSGGQRQLLCMARALLRSSKILILDEATSSIDTSTDAIIQSTIATAFKDSTVLTIAHRLHTIIGSDRVLVLDAGHVAEFDTPDALLAQQGGAFKSLVEETKSSLPSSA